jgi:protein DGCR14
MTFGTLSSTPIALRSSANEDAQQFDGPFKIPATPRREILAHRMVSDAKRKKSGGGGKGPQTPREKLLASVRGRTPRSGEDMSPAAKRLLDRTGGIRDLKKRRWDDH